MESDTQRHYAKIEPYKRKLGLVLNGEVIAQTNNALILKEVGNSVYNPVFYFPKEDVKMALLDAETERSSTCPIKGVASYWNLKSGKTDSYFAWSYEEPLAQSKKIAGYLAFNLDYLTLVSEPIDSQ
ncbi:MAG: hypothetical protein ACI8ZN_002285 [Bacteroidia bacterium]|jgi:uncharacterized protein (DUF427 family)